jgi:hypothetical protein
MKEMTKKLFYPLFALVVALSLAGVASAQGASKTLTGHIVDKACSGNVVKGGASAADGHSGSKGCAGKDGCLKSGLGLYADGKWTAFDAKGNELAKAALAKASKETGAKFKVVGELKGDTLAVTEITEAH